MLDIILKNGIIYDGTGRPPFKADIGILNDKVTTISKSITSPAKSIHDVTNYWICPGFIDIHTHYDAEVELNPSLDESVRHGVTSVIMGNCSMSLNIGEPETNARLFERVETIHELVAKWQQQANKWPDTKSYLNHMNNLKLGPNISLLTGHSVIRAEVMGLKRSLYEAATDDEINKMVQLAREALSAGTLGISIDMVHWHRASGKYTGRSLPSHYATYKEYAALADVCREYDAVFQLTPDPKKLFTSVYNIFRLTTGVFRAPLRCTVLSAMDLSINPLTWRATTTFASLCNNIFGANIRFQTLPQPFTIYSDGPMTPLFEEFESGYLLNNCLTKEERQDLWNSPEFKSKFKKDWLNYNGRTFKGDFNHIYTENTPVENWNNMRVADIAKNNNKEPLEFFISALEKYDTDFRWHHTGANTRDHILAKLANHQYILPGFSDAGAHCKNMAYFDSGITLLKQCVQKNWMPIEKAISRITYEPATWFNLNTIPINQSGEIGIIKVGSKADINILDPKKLKLPISKATLTNNKNTFGLARMINHYTEHTSPIKACYISGTKVIENGIKTSSLGLQKLGETRVLNSTAMTNKQSYNRHRNRINDQVIDHSLQNYWEIFVLKHTNRKNIILHVIAFILMYAIFFSAVALQNIWLMLLMPISQITGFLGHYFYEPSAVDKRDFVFSWRAFLSLHKLFYYVLTRKYCNEVKRVKALTHYEL